MPTFERDDVRLHYETVGEGFPVLAFAPGGMRSCIEAWPRAAYDPRTRLSPHFRVITMDQRNASARSVAPVEADDGWHSYTDDHLALLDHLGIERCHVLGNCIGGTFCLGLVERAPERVTAAVLQQPIGLTDPAGGDAAEGSGNRQLFRDLFDGWAAELAAQRPDVPPATWSAFRERMYRGDFVFGVSREAVARATTPMLVLMGNDPYHPSHTSRAIADLAPNAELVERWKEADVVEATVRRVIAFLQRHTPEV